MSLRYQMQEKINDLQKELEACRSERDALAAYVEGLKPALESFTLGLGVCCCGEEMNKHSFNSGHSPVDSGWYAIDQYMSMSPDASLLRREAALIYDLANQLEKSEAPGAEGGYMWDAYERAEWLRAQADKKDKQRRERDNETNNT